jgi:hypothetical protein
MKDCKNIQFKNLHSIKSKKKIYLGIEILRMFLSFFIVVVHAFNKYYARSKILLFPFNALFYYIPTFFVISFFFNYKTFVRKNLDKIKERFLRILIPYYIWPTIFFIRYHSFNYLNGIIESDKLKNLYYQYLIGDGFHGVFWFLFNLIFISLLFIIIIFLFKTNYLLIIIIIGIILSVFEYSGYISQFFSNYNHPILHSVKPLSSSFIYSISGFFFGFFNILDYFKNFRIKVISIFLFSFFLIIGSQNLFLIKYYIIRIDFVSIGLFLIFALFPFDKIKYNFIISIIKQITSYTRGVYYLHPEIHSIFKYNLKVIKNRELKGCIVNYIIFLFNLLFWFKNI